MITSWNTNGWWTRHCLRGLSWKAPYMPQWLKASHHPCQVGFFLPFHGWQRGSKHWPAHREAWKLSLLCWACPLPPLPSTPGSQPLSCSSTGSSACHFRASSMVWSSRIKPLGHLCFPSSSLPHAGITEPYRFFSWDVSRTSPFSVLLPLMLAQSLVSQAPEWCPREGGALFPSRPTLVPCEWRPAPLPCPSLLGVSSHCIKPTLLPWHSRPFSWPTQSHLFTLEPPCPAEPDLVSIRQAPHSLSEGSGD